MTNNLFDNSAKIDCCNNCTTETGRSIGCHSTCPKYLEQRKIRNEVQKSKFEQKQKNDMFNDINRKRNERIENLRKQKKLQKNKKFS